VVLVKLSDGSVRHLSVGRSDPSSQGWNEQSGGHLSARNTEGLSSWVFASYEKVDTSFSAVHDSSGSTRMMGEIVAWSLTPGKEARRLAWSHSSWSESDQGFDCYRAEPHPCPSRDGRRVMFASDWRRHVEPELTSYRPNTWRKAYVIDTRPTPARISDLADDPAGPLCAITLHWTAPAADLIDPGPGPVAAYDLRYSLDPITEESFYDQPALVPPAPLAPGQTQTLILGGIDDGGIRYFAVKAIGASGSRSAMSNVVGTSRVDPPELRPARPGRPRESACVARGPGVGLPNGTP